MFLRIDESVVDLIKNSNTSPNIILALDEIFRARRLGNHLIYCKTTDLELIEKTPGLSESTKLTIKKIKPLQRFKKTAFELMTTHINITATPNTFRKISIANKTIIEISIEKLTNGDFLNKTTLLAENLTDCDFFQSITKIINRKSTVLHSLQHNATPLPGGGSQTPRQYRLQKTTNDLTICIVDGDIEYQGAPLGTNTADPIDQDDAINPQPHCASLILECYSIENLIPVKAIIAQINNNAVTPPYLQKITPYQSDEFWPYIPLKIGKKCTDFIGNTPKSIYWARHKHKFKPLNQACQSWINGTCTQPCTVLENMHSSTALRVSEYFSTARLNGQLHQVENNINPLPQQIEALWNNIAATINSWTCCGERISAY